MPGLAEPPRSGVLDDRPEPELDELAALAALVCGTPNGAVRFLNGPGRDIVSGAGHPPADAYLVRARGLCAATAESEGGILVAGDLGSQPPPTATPDASRPATPDPPRPATPQASRPAKRQPLAPEAPELGSYAGAVIAKSRGPAAVLCAFGSEPRRFTGSQIAALQALARQAGALLDLHDDNAALRELAGTDPLTGVANRRRLESALQLALAGSAAARECVGVLFCDIDELKSVNDRYGHEAGDRLLCEIAGRLRAVASAGDTVARLSGDEFVLLCPRVPDEVTFEALATCVRAVRAPGPQPEAPGLRLSVGAALARPGESAAALLGRADTLMYAEKARRRTAGQTASGPGSRRRPPHLTLVAPELS